MTPNPAARVFAGILHAAPYLTVVAAMMPGLALPASSAHADSTLRLLAELSGDESSMDGSFGQSIALAGDLLVVGSPNDFGVHPDTGLGYQGSVTIFRRGETRCTIEAKLLASDAAVPDNFGFSVAIDGNLIVVGAPEHVVPSTHQRSGAVYVFRREAFSWFEEAMLTPSDGEHSDGFGWSVDVRQDMILVGSPMATGLVEAYGAAYLFRRVQDEWIEEHQFTIDPQFAGARSGWSVAFSGEDALVGAWGPSLYKNNAGAVYCYQYDGLQWKLAQLLQQDNIDLQQSFGVDLFSWAIDANESTLLAGAPSSDHGDGAALIFDKVNGDWIQRQELPTPFDTAFHSSFGGVVAITDGFAAVAPWQDFPVLYRFDGDGWMNQGVIRRPDGSAHVAISLAMNGRLLAIGFFGAPIYLYDLCPMDINADGVTGPADLSMLLDDFGTDAFATDLNNDGVVDTADLGILISAFGEQCP